MKTLRTAALVVGAVVAVAAAIPTGGGSTLLAGALGVTAGTAATIASATAIATSAISTLTAKKPSAQATGSQTAFAADPDAGIPWILGRTGTAGNIVYRTGFDTRDAGDNDRQAFVTVLSLGPSAAIEGFTADRALVTFNGNGQAVGAYGTFMWQTRQLGALSEPALSFGTGAGTPPGWTANHRLSGKCAATWTLRFDTKAKVYQNGVPAPMWVVRGAFCYDPRKDSTYPGGSGPHRMADPADRAAYDAAVATWEWTENPYILGLRFVHGIWQRDISNPSSDWVRIMGMGAPQAGIDVASYVEGANVADANGWAAGGVIFSGDDKWASLKKILQAGMGEPLALGAKIGCLVNAPKVSLATIGIDDVVGDASVGATQPRRSRVNTITPRYRLEDNNWQLLPGSPITVADYVAIDRGRRSRVQDYPFIQNTKQVGTAVRYDIENAREFGPIVLPLKLFWMGYKPGDCVTATLPELGLNAQPILLLNRSLDPSGGVVTMTARSEAPGKHPFALGQTATPPPTPGVTGAPIVPVPGENAWAITGLELVSGETSVPALIVTGAIDAATADAVVFEYRPFISGQAAEAGWRAAGIETPTTTRKEIVSVTGDTAYEVSVQNRARGVLSGRRILGPVVTAVATGLEGPPGKDGAAAFSLLDIQYCADPEPAAVIKRGGGEAFNAKARTGEFGGSATISGLIVPGSFIALTTDPYADLSYVELDYAIHWSDDTGIFVWRNGVKTTGIGTRPTEAGPVRATIRKEGDRLSYFVEGFPAPASHTANASNEQVCGAFVLYHEGSRIDGITYSLDGAPGEDGLPGDDGIALEVTGPESINIACYADGTPRPDAFENAKGQFKVRLGEQTLTSGVGFAIIAVDGCTPHVDATGFWNIDGLTKATNAFATFQISYGSLAPFNKTILFNKALDGSSASYNQNQGSLGAFGSATFTLLAEVDLTVPPGATVQATGRTDYGVQQLNGRTFTAETKLTYQNITDGAAETDVPGSTATGSTASFSVSGPAEDPITTDTPGSAASSGTFSGPVASKTIRARLYVRKSGGSGNAANINGLVSLRV